MNLRAKVIAVTIAAIALISGGTAAFADDDDDDKRPISGSTEFPRPHHPHKEEDELHDRYGDDIGQVNLPPLVVKEQPKTGTANTGGAEAITGNAKPNETLVDAGTTNPAANVPVDPSQINPNQGTPAENFFNAASAGLGVMGLGVVSLATIAIRRSAKLRKDPKADFLYQ